MHLNTELMKKRLLETEELIRLTEEQSRRNNGDDQANFKQA